MKVVRKKIVSFMMASALVVSPLLSTLFIPTKTSAEDIIVNNEEITSEEDHETENEESESLDDLPTSEENAEEVVEEEVSGDEVADEQEAPEEDPIDEESQNEDQAEDSTDVENDSLTDSETGEDGDGSSENNGETPPSTEDDGLTVEEDSDIEENGNDEGTNEEEEDEYDEYYFEDRVIPTTIELNDSTISFAQPLSLDARTLVLVNLDNLMNDEDYKVYESLFVSADDMANMVETDSYLILMLGEEVFYDDDLLEEELDSWFHLSLIIPSSIFSGDEDVLITKKFLESGVSEMEKTKATFQLTITEGTETIHSFDEPILVESLLVSDQEITNLKYHYYQDGYWYDENQNGQSYTGFYWAGEYYDYIDESMFDEDELVIFFGGMVYGSLYHPGIFGLAEEGVLTLGDWTEPENPEDNGDNEENEENPSGDGDDSAGNQPEEDPAVDEEDDTETGETGTNEESGSSGSSGSTNEAATPVNSGSNNNDNGDSTLPNTATNSYNQLLIGSILILVGGVVFFLPKTVKRRQRPYVLS
ncbi:MULTISPECIES: LPXTG cell wall anchor domain-containing protein [Bacillaceae]|uniref:Gram-positive cocci surface proteins LPxTG domain-containing protein n=1 Tax=Evansella alkalicola TaxID=745819 RepID=A0ABS6JXZ5_9BACI|nr:LPXTG cell wall anchor domain-containing protein [Litchfieldia alkalitelluris]MBU9723265.1 hypothetical protein [Bacillus alkalicola]